jgi:uncharacterized membrane protein YqjE
VAKVRALLLAALSFISLAMLVVTAVEPKWIEEFFGAEPDAGSGSAEALVTLVFVAFTVISGLSAFIAWRKVGAHRRGRPTADRGLQ